MHKKAKKPKSKKKVQKRESAAEESIVNTKGIGTINNDKEETNHKQTRRKNQEHFKHELMLPIIARPSRLSEMLASSTLGSKSSTLATRRKQEKPCQKASMMFIASNATNCNRIVYPENWKDES